MIKQKCIEEQKCYSTPKNFFLLSLTAINSFAIFFRSMLSVSRLWTCKSMTLLKSTCFIVDLRKFFNRRIAENVRSAVAEVTGIVSKICRSW